MFQQQQATSTGWQNPPQQPGQPGPGVIAVAAAPAKVETMELCRKGHKMNLMDYTTGFGFLSMHRPQPQTRKQARRQAANPLELICSGCYFKLMPSEKVFLCETCIVSNPQAVGGAGSGMNENFAVVFCETCVNNGVHSTPSKPDWSTSLFSCCAAPGACLDASFCWCFKAAGLSTFMGPRVDGRPPGDDHRCQNHCVWCQIFYMDIFTLGSIGGCMLGRLYTRAASLNTIDPLPGGCSACLTGWFCRWCLLARIHREFLPRKAELGEPMGCLCNCGGEIVNRKPHVSYTKIQAPVAMMAMGQQVMGMGQQMVGTVPAPGVDVGQPMAMQPPQQQQGAWGAQPQQQQQQQQPWGAQPQ